MTKAKKFTGLTLLALLVFAASFFYFSSPIKASPPEEVEINELFSKYYGAIQAGDVDTLTELVIDTRFPDAASLKEGYEAAIEEEVIYDVKVLRIFDNKSTKSATFSNFVKNYESSDVYYVELAVKNDINGEFNLTLPVVYDNNTWKIMILPTEVPPAN